jgi:hypothetical protein
MQDARDTDFDSSHWSSCRWRQRTAGRIPCCTDEELQLHTDMPRPETLTRLPCTDLGQGARQGNVAVRIRHEWMDPSRLCGAKRQPNEVVIAK